VNPAPTAAQWQAAFARAAAVNAIPVVPPPPGDAARRCAAVVDTLNDTLGHTPLAVVLTGPGARGGPA
jgi:hypothetical protein